MSLDEQEKSVSDAQPIELYEFTRGSRTWRYTSANDERIALGQVWEPRPIRTSALQQTARDSPPTFTVRVPWADDLFVDFQPIAPTDQLLFRMYRFHSTDSSPHDIRLWYTGQAIAIQVIEDATVASISLVTKEADLVREIPRLSFSRQCPLVLGGARCKVDFLSSKVGHAYQGHFTVATQGSDRTVTLVTDLVNFPAFWFSGGELIYSGTRRLILNHEADGTLILLQPFPVNIVGQRVVLRVGCDHIKGSVELGIEGNCANKFVNTHNHGGWPWIPTKDPSDSFLYLKP